ncbi:unnamed protein product [Rotaria sp. Silwood2]|nr:unnamed protein product [Rotaria sp. Silwood2]
MTDLTSSTPSTSLNTSQTATTTTGSNANKKSKVNPLNKNKKVKSSTTTHPKYSIMIKQAITQLNDRNGTSKAALLKYILANYKVNSITANQHLKSALRAGIKNKTLKQTKGIGASGSFKLGLTLSNNKKTTIHKINKSKNQSKTTTQKKK